MRNVLGYTLGATSIGCGYLGYKMATVNHDSTVELVFLSPLPIGFSAITVCGAYYLLNSASKAASNKRLAIKMVDWFKRFW